MANLTENEMEEATLMVMNVVQDLLKNEKINYIYQSFETNDQANDWIIQSALEIIRIYSENILRMKLKSENSDPQIG